MEFNPNKCTVIHITTRKHPIATPYLLHDHALAHEENSKYLGVTINQDLKWNKHIANTTTKANRTLGFIKRNMKDCKTSAKAAAYKTLIRPTLEYASVVWDPYKGERPAAWESTTPRCTFRNGKLHRLYTRGRNRPVKRSRLGHTGEKTNQKQAVHVL